MADSTVVRRSLAVAVLTALSPLALAACGLTGTSATTTGTSSEAAGGGPTWFFYQQGTRPPSPTPPAWPAPKPSATTAATAPAAPASTSPGPGSAPCAGRLRKGKMDGLAVTPGSGSAVVTWPNAGDGTVESYRVAAVSQQLRGGEAPAPTWVTVDPGTGCAQLTATLSGLEHDADYVFWLDAIVKLPAGERRDLMIARSEALRIP